MTALFQLDFQSYSQEDWARFDLYYNQIMQTIGIHSHNYNTLKEKGQSSKPKLKPKIKSCPCNYVTPL